MKKIKRTDGQTERSAFTAAQFIFSLRGSPVQKYRGIMIYEHLAHRLQLWSQAVLCFPLWHFLTHRNFSVMQHLVRGSFPLACIYGSVLSELFVCICLTQSAAASAIYFLLVLNVDSRREGRQKPNLLL